jgi:hypothetical protein
VDLFEDDAATFPESDIYESVTMLYRKVFELSSRLSPPQGQELVLPESPADLSFVVSYILEIDAEEKQDLLEMTSTAQRMKTLVSHLGDTVRKLEQQIVYKEAMTKARGNGHLRNPH